MRRFKELDDKVMQKYLKKLLVNLSFHFTDFELSLESADHSIHTFRIDELRSTLTDNNSNSLEGNFSRVHISYL